MPLAMTGKDNTIHDSMQYMSWIPLTSSLSAWMGGAELLVKLFFQVLWSQMVHAEMAQVLSSP
jgi:hypothetical protein